MLIRTLILLNVPFVVSKLFKIKHLTSNLYIGKSGRYPKWLTLARANSFIEKPSKENGKVIMKVTDLRNKVWNIEKNKKCLIYFPEHRRSNQIFEIQRSEHGWIKITNNDKCLTYIKDKKRFELRKCDDGRMTQVFLMADEEGKVMSDQDIDEMEIKMDLDPMTAFGMPNEEMMNVRIDGMADRSDWLEAALQSYMMAGGEKGDVNALELAAKTYFDQTGRTDTIGLNMVDELELAAKAYLRKNGMIDTSKMNGTDVMATLARVHPFAGEFQGARNKAMQGMPSMGMTGNQPFPTTIDSFGNPYNFSIQQLNDPFDFISVLPRLDFLKMYLNGAPGYNTPSPLRHTSYPTNTHRPSWRM